MALTILVCMLIVSVGGVWVWVAWRLVIRPFAKFRDGLDSCEVCWHKKWPRGRLVDAWLPAEPGWKSRSRVVHRRCAQHSGLSFKQLDRQTRLWLDGVAGPSRSARPEGSI